MSLFVCAQSVMSHAATLHKTVLRLKARGFYHPRWDAKQPSIVKSPRSQQLRQYYCETEIPGKAQRWILNAGEESSSCMRAAPERPAEERARFVDEACESDSELCRQLKSLLAQDLGASGPLNGVAWENFPRLLADIDVAHFEPGAQVGPHRIEARIGAGGMVQVYRARDTRLNRLVAIKICVERFSDRFAREARAISALNHPHICTLYDVGPNYLVLEYLEGETLDTRLGTRTLPLNEALPLAIQIADALEAAHRSGMVHRDLKPANIMLTKSGSKLLDFGLVRIIEGMSADDYTLARGATEPGMILGTARYMSPEQAEGKKVDARSDIFSFGAVLYEMITGQQAFSGTSVVDVLIAIMRDEPRPVRRSPEIARIVARCLRKRPSERFQSMADIKAALSLIAAKPMEQKPSVAVLPFANMSRDADDEYFSDGLAEEILNVLAHIQELKVIARTSSFAFRGKEQDITKIAEALRVGTILEGSVRRAGSRIRVTVQLIDAVDGSNLWSERYDRELTDVFAVQDEIATAIAGALQVELTGKPTRPHQPNLPAYEALLKGRHQMVKSSPDAWKRARGHFEQSIALDPDYAEPHAELAYCFFNVGFWGLRPPTEAMLLARVEASRALELSPADPIAHLVLCVVAALYDCDWREAEHQYRLGLAADPVPPIFRARLFYNLVPQGRFEEAIREIETALEQDPLSTHTQPFIALPELRGNLRSRDFGGAEGTGDRREIWVPHWSSVRASLSEECSPKPASQRKQPSI
jgi:TolB-like protein/tRNA A-37 threonylcarbamoyl transferase component Bud32